MSDWDEMCLPRWFAPKRASWKQASRVRVIPNSPALYEKTSGVPGFGTEQHSHHWDTSIAYVLPKKKNNNKVK